MQDNVAFLAGDIGRLFRKRFEAADDEGTSCGGLTGPQLRLIGAISRNPGASQIALANLLDVEPITAARMLDRLQQAGLVERRPDPADRRAWRLHLKPRAEPLLIAAWNRIEVMVDAALEGFSDEERATLDTLLKRLRDNLATDAPLGGTPSLAPEMDGVAANG
jgi:DNA-binding MarR family transcriptional regulator